ncbi:hypothetical protein BI084_gp79 [Gordonia phage Terapin]|uniref:Uncharacterized protein n=4 Tax=Terapinvirus terapin TaxID=2734283 RepID=A0A345MBB8_9CAUD|nr:hypothetical protein BI084_gp79 [Gordonia phage Terapin]AOE44891.1 hypothetical protein SEA_TERAPIN_79 [Gordonia phage Terapin]AVP43355.1 hypothetical protein PBI_DJOKOVIC_78 [Gordonia phage Djokovic]AXH67789.1 hypothetical protein SEA_BEYONCAGE_78 [Gordonia phage Beyoncage]QOC56648.1 hypothetical protein SEA_BITESIZE_78 [Gordonia phage BiteSize]
MTDETSNQVSQQGEGETPPSAVLEATRYATEEMRIAMRALRQFADALNGQSGILRQRAQAQQAARLPGGAAKALTPVERRAKQAKRKASKAGRKNNRKGKK